MLMTRQSPGLRSFAGFVRSPFSFTLPPSIACCAAERVLKKRAAQSHLSILTALSLTASDGPDAAHRPCIDEREPSADDSVEHPDAEHHRDDPRDRDTDDRDHEKT